MELIWFYDGIKNNSIRLIIISCIEVYLVEVIPCKFQVNAEGTKEASNRYRRLLTSKLIFAVRI